MIAIVDLWPARFDRRAQALCGGLANTREFAQVGEPVLAVENLCFPIT